METMKDLVVRYLMKKMENKKEDIEAKEEGTQGKESNDNGKSPEMVGPSNETAPMHDHRGKRPLIVETSSTAFTAAVLADIQESIKAIDSQVKELRGELAGLKANAQGVEDYGFEFD